MNRPFGVEAVDVGDCAQGAGSGIASGLPSRHRPRLRLSEMAEQKLEQGKEVVVSPNLPWRLCAEAPYAVSGIGQCHGVWPGKWASVSVKGAEAYIKPGASSAISNPESPFRAIMRLMGMARSPALRASQIGLADR
ncbi:hypothetical protein FQR65_LT20544 [Abscondita terminalis]|nr:hypothetical protein FQR65_LT20544 [Abscondita terminalis]